MTFEQILITFLAVSVVFVSCWSMRGQNLRTRELCVEWIKMNQVLSGEVQKLHETLRKTKVPVLPMAQIHRSDLPATAQTPARNGAHANGTADPAEMIRRQKDLVR